MTDITKLADKWREGFVPMNEGAHASKAMLDCCADELEAVLPKWTKITDDESTWPEDDQDVIVACGPTNTRDFAVWQTPFKQFELYMNDGYIPISNAWQHPIHWRPLCDLDYPPEDES